MQQLHQRFKRIELYEEVLLQLQGEQPIPGFALGI